MAIVRTMRADEVEQAVAWAAQEGWNPGEGDARAFLAHDPGAFLMAEEGGRMLACISAAQNGASHGFIGFYIAAPGVRGQGHGLAVWQAAMARLAGRGIGLDGVVAQQASYRRSGFGLAWNNARYVGAVTPGATLPAASTVPFGDLVAYDAACFGVARPQFLREWIDAPGRVAVVLPGVRGFAVGRRGVEGTRVGPLFADDSASALRLLGGLAAALPGPFVLDVPEANAASVALALGAGMQKTFETARMYVGAPPTMAMEKIFGVTSLEFG